jgi:putative FmdB family regulatory protein
MPIYEYQCQSCGHQLEVLQKISDEPLTYCPECGEPTLQKLISAAAFRLKGGGWYETDFKSGKQKNLAGDKGAAESSNKSKSKNKDTGSTAKSPTATKSSPASSGS